ncbi:hypothetical protein A0O00_11195 [Proteus mirabilis]|nr:hypothetical protein A0O00_11195 [Proteus mirabilis]
MKKKLKDPDLQFAISEATAIVAKKGDKTKSELLQEIIVSKINNENEDTDLLLDHALEITKRLTSSEIKLLAFIYYHRQTGQLIDNKPVISIIEDYKNNVVHPTVTLERCYSLSRLRFHIDYPLLKKNHL